MTKTTHGGKRPGAGRPRKFGAELCQDHTICWPPSAWRIVDDYRLPGGSWSDGLRRCLFSRDGLRELKAVLRT